MDAEQLQMRPHADVLSSRRLANTIDGNSRSRSPSVLLPDTSCRNSHNYSGPYCACYTSFKHLMVLEATYDGYSAIVTAV
jgi:hypothetical protein